MDIGNISLFLFFNLWTSYALASGTSGITEDWLMIEPFDPILRVGSNVTVKCTLSNGTMVATNWSIKNHTVGDVWLKNIQYEEEYVVTNLKYNEIFWMKCSYGNLSNRTSLTTKGDVSRPIVNCTSLTKFDFKCEWNKDDNATHYTFEYREHLSDNKPNWKLVRLTAHGDRNPWVYISDGRKLQEIRVNATNNFSHTSSNMQFDIIANLKPNITYKGSTTTNTSVSLEWSTGDIYTGYCVQSEVAYGDKNVTTKNKTIIIDNLKPGRPYTFYIRSRYDREPNNFTEWKLLGNATTKDSRPSDTVKNLNRIGSSHGDTIGLIVWDPVPEESQNGNILGYTVSLTNDRNANATTTNVSAQMYDFKETIDDVSYNVCVGAYNSAGPSPIKCTPVHRMHTLEEKSGIHPSKSTIGIIAVVMLLAMVLTSIGYTNIRRMELFIKWPDPAFPEIKSFSGVVFPVVEEEQFDDFRLPAGTCNPVDSTNVCKDNYTHIDEENSFISEDRDELDSPLVYQLISGKRNGSLESLSQSIQYIRIAKTTMVEIEDSCYCECPPNQTSCSDNKCLCSEYISMHTSFVQHPIEKTTNHDDYVPKNKCIGMQS